MKGWLFIALIASAAILTATACAVWGVLANPAPPPPTTMTAADFGFVRPQRWGVNVRTWKAFKIGKPVRATWTIYRSSPYGERGCAIGKGE